MKVFHADLHIHTVLSPCGDLDMGPDAIVRQALAKGLDIIGITDHNSTRQSPIVREIGQAEGLTVLMGAEVTSREEVHCLAFFENEWERKTFQEFLDTRLPNIANNTDKFGYQLLADAHGQIVYEEPRLLLPAIDAGIDEICRRTQELGGLFVPAHIDKAHNSIISQLGLVPPDLPADALELSPHTTRQKALKKWPYLSGHAFVDRKSVV